MKKTTLGHAHRCPECSRLIRWALLFCVDCAWRFRDVRGHIGNPPCECPDRPIGAGRSLR